MKINSRSWKKALKEIKNLPKQKKQELEDQTTAAARKNIIEQILAQKPEWTYEDAIRACTGEDGERDPECSMWWKIAPYINGMRTKRLKLQARDVLLDDEEKKIFDEKIMPLNVTKEVYKGAYKAIVGKK